MQFKSMTKMALMSFAALLVCGVNARAQTKLTVGVGHMCCDSCKTGAKSALAKVSSDVAIDGKNVTVTMKQNATDIVPVLDALRKGGFPATSIDAGASPVTFKVAHMCCGKCVASIKTALADSKIEALDQDSIKAGDGMLTLKAKDGMKLDLIPVMAALEKGGFSATSITLGTTAAHRVKPGKVAVGKGQHGTLTFAASAPVH